MPDQTDQNIADNVKRLRDQHGLKQSELVDQLRVNGLHDWHPTTLSRTESGERPVRLSEALVLAHVLGTTPEELGESYSPAARAVEAAEGALQRVAQARSTVINAREDYVGAWKTFVDLIRAGAEAAEDDPVLKRRIRSAVERSVAVKPSDDDMNAAEDEQWVDERWRWDDGTVSRGIAAQDGLQGR